MELENDYKKLLVHIHDSEGENILLTEIPKKRISEGIHIQDLLDYLIKIELVEYDKQYEAYYLTTEGYEQVEDIKSRIEIEGTMKNLEHEHSSGGSRISIYARFGIGLFLLVGFYFMLNGIRANRNHINIDEVLDEELLEKIQKDVKIKTDSLLKEQELKELNEKLNK